MMQDGYEEEVDEELPAQMDDPMVGVSSTAPPQPASPSAPQPASAPLSPPQAAPKSPPQPQPNTIPQIKKELPESVVANNANSNTTTPATTPALTPTANIKPKDEKPTIPFRPPHIQLKPPALPIPTQAAIIQQHHPALMPLPANSAMLETMGEKGILAPPTMGPPTMIKRMGVTVSLIIT